MSPSGASFSMQLEFSSTLTKIIRGGKETLGMKKLIDLFLWLDVIYFVQHLCDFTGSQSSCCLLSGREIFTVQSLEESPQQI